MKQNYITNPLLSIAIPTYNRSDYLELNLSILCKQIRESTTEIELIISNNHSTDTTEQVIHKYIDSGIAIRYISNETNIGADKNIVQCFNLARGKYVLILGDDDVLCDGALNSLIPLLNDNFGVIYLNSYTYNKNYITEAPKIKDNKFIVYKNTKAFIRKVHVQLTFISAIVTHKSLIVQELDTEQFLDTNLAQLSWVIPALVKAGRNAYFNRHLVAQKADNTGGYSVCRVFGVNLQHIFNSFVARGIEKSYFNIITHTLLINFLPSIIISLKKNQGNFIQENYLSTLSTTFKYSPIYWLATFPVIILPYRIGKLWYKLCKLLLKICRLPFKLQT